jgi:hypothetical protein
MTPMKAPRRNAEAAYGWRKTASGDLLGSLEQIDTGTAKPAIPERQPDGKKVGAEQRRHGLVGQPAKGSPASLSSLINRLIAFAPVTGWVVTAASAVKVTSFNSSSAPVFCSYHLLVRS